MGIAKNKIFELRSLADLPFAAKEVGIAVVYGARKSVHGALFFYEDRVYTIMRYGNVLDYPVMFSAFRKLTKLPDKVIREARKEWLELKVSERDKARINDLRSEADRAGYRLVKKPS